MPILSNKTPIFELQGVWHTYPGAQEITALRGVDISIDPGEYVAVIGANGSGKSTLARHLNALLLPTRGNILTGGISTSDKAGWGQIRRTVQMVFQKPDAQIIATTVEEDVAFGLENFRVPASAMPGRVQSALETVGMWELRARAPHQLSAGQKQRVAIAGALAVQPQALVLDEATAMLDPVGRQAVLDVLSDLHANGSTIVTITHEMDEAALAERIVVLDHGQVALDGPPRDVFRQAARLRSLGLDLPPVAGLALRLNLPVCLTVDELIAALRPRPENAGAQAMMVHQQEVAPVDDIQPAIQISGLSHVYLRGTPLESRALANVNIEVARGSVMGLIGPTGSGKSTLMQHLNGLIRPQSGQVIVEGIDWSDPTVDAWAARQRIGLLFQQAEDQLFEQFVGDDVAYGPRQMKLDRAEVRQRVQTAMEAVGLPFEEYKDRLCQSLSGGEQRRAALAGVLALQPEMLVTDEPTAGLDPRGRSEIIAILRQVHQHGADLVIGSHRMEDIAALCDQVVELQDGRVAASGQTRHVLYRAGGMHGQTTPLHPVSAIAAGLGAAGWPIPPDVITIDELQEAIDGVRMRLAGGADSQR